jgi:DnaJ-class molecular chaperone
MIPDYGENRYDFTLHNQPDLASQLSFTERFQKCEVCDGEGEVHSHNPICWECRGYGYVEKEKAQ